MKIKFTITPFESVFIDGKTDPIYHKYKAKFPNGVFKSN